MYTNQNMKYKEYKKRNIYHAVKIFFLFFITDVMNIFSLSSLGECEDDSMVWWFDGIDVRAISEGNEW